jgi:hypothetical protein
MKNHIKSERHFALDAIFPSKPKRIPPPPIRTRPTLWQRMCRLFGGKA